jgi:hypothetical protein
LRAVLLACARAAMATTSARTATIHKPAMPNSNF